MSIARPIDVPQTDPKAGYLAHKSEIDAAVRRVINSGWYIMGREVKSFEQEYASYIGAHHGIGVASGTDALELALRACGVGPGDLVFTVSHTAVATVAAIELAGATPVFIDINPETYTIDANHLEDSLAKPPAGVPRAIIPVHLYGHPANMQDIKTLADHYSLYLIEDCAQSHGACAFGRKTGMWGDAGTFSFYPTKNLAAIGDGGAIVTNNIDLKNKIRLLQQYGWAQRYVSEIPGLNSRLDEIQAAILSIKLSYLDAENTRRREIAEQYSYYLNDTPLILPKEAAWCRHVYHQYVVRTPQRELLKSFLKQLGIGTLIHYPLPVHMQPAYQGRIPIGRGGLNNAEIVAKEVLSLPMYPQLTDAQIEQISNAVRRWYNLI